MIPGRMTPSSATHIPPINPKRIEIVVDKCSVANRPELLATTIAGPLRDQNLMESRRASFLFASAQAFKPSMYSTICGGMGESPKLRVGAPIEGILGGGGAEARINLPAQDYTRLVSGQSAGFILI